jgi:tetratricopeptide (TPR) repeat protein
VSLINQVLKDIDQRNVDKTLSSPVYNPAKKKGNRYSKNAVAKFIAGLILTATAAFVLFKYLGESNTLMSITETSLEKNAQLNLNLIDTRSKIPVRPIPMPNSVQYGTAANEVTDPIPPVVSQQNSITKTVRGDQQAQNFYAQAQQAIAQRNPEKARALLRQAIDTYPAHHQSRLLLARLLLEQRQPDAAHQLMAQGLLLAPGNEEFILMQAHSAMLGSDIDTAISILQGSLQISPRSGDYHAFLGTLLQRKNRHPEAIAQFTAALRQSPRNAEWLVGIGISMQNEKMTLAATQAFQQAIDLGTLTPSLTAFAQQQLAVLSRQR